MNIFKPDETMLHNYLQNKLSPSDEEQMELWLADHPDALEELEFDLMMKGGVEQEISYAKTKNGSLSIAQMFNHKLVYLLGGAAFAAIFMLSIFNFKQASQPESSFQIIQLNHLRGNSINLNAGEAIKIENTINNIVIQLQMNFPEGLLPIDGVYQVVIKNNTTDDVVANMSGLLPLNVNEYRDGEFNIGVQKSALIGGDYSVSVLFLNDEIAVFTLKVK